MWFGIDNVYLCASARDRRADTYEWERITKGKRKLAVLLVFMYTEALHFVLVRTLLRKGGGFFYHPGHPLQHGNFSVNPGRVRRTNTEKRTFP